MRAVPYLAVTGHHGTVGNLLAYTIQWFITFSLWVAIVSMSWRCMLSSRTTWRSGLSGSCSYWWCRSAGRYIWICSSPYTSDKDQYSSLLQVHWKKKRDRSAYVFFVILLQSSLLEVILVRTLEKSVWLEPLTKVIQCHCENHLGLCPNHYPIVVNACPSR